MDTFHYRKSIPCGAEEFDLIVVGGGPAGCAAAVCGARNGLRVLVIEATGTLGGMGTSGLVNAFDPMADGERNLVAGFMKELVDELYRRGGLGPFVTPEFWNKRYMCWTPFSCEELKRLLDEKMCEAKVQVSFFTTLVDVDAAPDHTVSGIIVHNIEGMRYLRAKAFIDATGDAVLVAAAGAECLVNSAPMPPTLCSLHAGIDWERAKHVNQQDALERAIADGHFTVPDRHLPGMTAVGESLGYLNAGHFFGFEGISAASRSRAMERGRRQLVEYADFYRKYVPGCEKMIAVISASLLGIRESRRIVGEYQLNFDDFRNRRQFADQIGVFNKFVDIHVKNPSEEEYRRFQAEELEIGRLGVGECFGLPYRILIPRGWKNLWAAGRCASSDERAHGSIRVQPAASMMGQAAGTAAAIALKSGVPAYGVDTGVLIGTLRKQGAYLPQNN